MSTNRSSSLFGLIKCDQFYKWLVVNLSTLYNLMFRIIHGICWPKAKQQKNTPIRKKTDSLAEWVVHVHRFVDGKPHVRNVGCHHTWACLWSQHIQGSITLLQKSTWDFLNPYHNKLKIYRTCRTILRLRSWFQCLSFKEQKQQLVLQRNKGTDIHTALHAVANCTLSNEQTTFSDSLISEHADPCHAHSSNNESVSNSKFERTTP